MSRTQLILRSLAFYWRTHLGVLAGTILTGAILTGALVVGDSVRHSLDRMAMTRLGNADLALTSPEQFFRAALADELKSDLRGIIAPVLLWRGTVTEPESRLRANDVQIVGVEDRFWKVGGVADPLAGAAAEEVVVNAPLADRLQLAPDTAVIIRMEQPSFVSRDAPLSGKADVSLVLRAKVRAVAGDGQFGRFGLAANQVPPLTVFVPLSVLQAKMKRAGQVNTLLVAGSDLAHANAAIQHQWKLPDIGVEFRALPGGKGTELRTDAVFLRPPIAAAAQSLATDSATVLTYLVNELRSGDKMAPYSFVTAAGSALKDNEVSINAWLADDLGVKLGDDLTLEYYVVGERRELLEQTAKFRIVAITPLENDPSWMPAYPGLADAANCRDWEPGIPIDNAKIRNKDEAYWKEYKGTPKARINLAAGQRLWNNRFGNVTSIRYPTGDIAGLSAKLQGKLDPVSLGLFFVDVREQALAASANSMDFGGLFIGFSLFLIVAALLLTAMLFVFNIEQRNEQVGLLRAIGFPPKLVRRALLGEGLVLAVIGATIGVLAGTVYTKLTLHGLNSVWGSAVGSMQLVYFAKPVTLAIGFGSSLEVALLAMWLVVRNQGKQPAADLLAGQGGERDGRLAWWRTWIGSAIGGVMLASALVTLVMAGRARGQEAAAMFFTAGMCLLIAGIGFSQRLLVRLMFTGKLAATIGEVGLRNAARRRGRSLTTISVLAGGVFLVVAVNAFRHNLQETGTRRESGTGGFVLWAQSSLPVYEDLNQKAGRESYNLPAKVMTNVTVVPLRLREGDEASCLNLNRAQQPRVWGVAPAELAQRKAFSFVAGEGWEILERPEGDGAVPCVADKQTLDWALRLKIGDTVEYTDDNGQPVKLRIVGAVAPSVLQGGLVVAEKNFVKHFAMSSGYRVFLVDAPRERVEEVQKALARGLEDKGLELLPAWKRLADFMAVENTYLAIFQVLGGLGLLLGSIGLGIVVLRNVLERRGELALLQAVGYRKPQLRWLVLSEHWLLIVLGLVVGVVTAVLAVLPAWRAPGTEVPAGGLALIVLGLAVGGLLWSWLAARVALRGSLLGGLRNE
jgi:ABC-type lipoprotein release transport system permease subunit